MDAKSTAPPQELPAQMAALCQELDTLKREKAELSLRLEMTIEHADEVTDELHDLTGRLQKRVAQLETEPPPSPPVISPEDLPAQAAALCRQVETLKREKDELALLLYMTTEHADDVTDELHNLTERLRKRATQLEASSQVGRQITSILNVENLLPEVVKGIQAKFDYYFVGIFLPDDTQQTFILQASHGRDAQQCLPPGFVVRPAADKGIIPQVCRTGRAYLAKNIEADPLYFPLAELPDTRSELVLSLRIGEKIIGALDIQSDRLATFEEDDQIVLQALADQIAVAIRNAQLYKLEKDLHQLEEERAHHLTQLNANKDKFFSIVAHDLRAPFQPLLGISRALAETADHASPQDIQKASDTIYRSAVNVYGLLENLLQWSRMQRGHMPYEPAKLDLPAIVEQIIRLLIENAAGKGVNLRSRLVKDIGVYADENMLRATIRNLTSNALKFTPHGGRITISAQLWRGTDGPSPPLAASSGAPFLEVSVTDTGVGILPADLEKLFKIEVHHSTPGTAQEQGSGLGLILCQEMVERNGGQIWIESQVGEGTTVKFTVPLLPSTSLAALEASAGFEEEPVGRVETAEIELLVAPPPEEMAALHELAVIGSISGLKKYVVHLESLGEQYWPFAHKLRQLAADFEMEQIVALVERHRQAQEAQRKT